MHRPAVAAATAVLALIASAALAAAATTPTRPGFHAQITNAWFPAAPGMRWVYRGLDSGRPARDVVRVTDRVAIVDGMPCAVISDRLYIRGRLEERTTDWYTQDRRGTVWYYGERTAELDRHGRVVTREGSWQAGRRGARPGVFMPARPRVGQSFAQEHFGGHAEDHFRVISRQSSVTVPFGAFRGRVLLTHEWTPLERGVLDGKWYVKGVGEVRESALKGPAETAELVALHR